MNASLINAGTVALPPAEAAMPAIAGLVPIEKIRWRWPVVFAAAITALMTAGLARELFGEGLGALLRRVPTNPFFYGALGLLYLSPPIFDWLIFRKLWRIPAVGLAALLKKRIANEVLFGYSGDAYFYAWARVRMKMVTAPFGTVKDVSILSAIAGNAITLAMLGIALPFALDLLAPGHFWAIVGSAAIIFAVSLPVLLSFKRIFALLKPTWWWVFGLHCLRIIVGSTLIALTWHFAMPDVSVEIWLLLAAARLLVSQLPLALNKDLLFTNATTLIIGQGQALSQMVALTAALLLLAHTVVLAVVELSAIMGRRS